MHLYLSKIGCQEEQRVPGGQDDAGKDPNDEKEIQGEHRNGKDDIGGKDRSHPGLQLRELIPFPGWNRYDTQDKGAHL